MDEKLIIKIPVIGLVKPQIEQQLLSLTNGYDNEFIFEASDDKFIHFSNFKSEDNLFAIIVNVENKSRQSAVKYILKIMNFYNNYYNHCKFIFLPSQVEKSHIIKLNNNDVCVELCDMDYVYEEELKIEKELKENYKNTTRKKILIDYFIAKKKLESYKELGYLDDSCYNVEEDLNIILNNKNYFNINEKMWNELYPNQDKDITCVSIFVDNSNRIEILFLNLEKNSLFCKSMVKNCEDGEKILNCIQI